MIEQQEAQPILIVDDNPTNLEILMELLTKAGFVVAVAIDGESALEQAEYDPPQLILLDVIMPGIDGFQTCQQLKEHPITKDIPVIFTTALADTENKTKGLAMGAVDYITKPFNQEEVIARVKTHVNLRRFAQTMAKQNQLLKTEIERRDLAETSLRKLTNELETRVQERTVQLQQAQLKLIQQEKMSTLGQLVTGVAQEINHPINFLIDNLAPVQKHISTLQRIINLYQQHYSQPVPIIAATLEKANLEGIWEELRTIVSLMNLGFDHLCNLSSALQSFSRSDGQTKTLTNIHRHIDICLLILQHRFKTQDNCAKIEVCNDYGSLPQVWCYPGKLNQVLINILNNSIDAIEEAQEKGKIAGEKGKLTINTTVVDNQKISIGITDNGMGMTPQVQQHIFTPTFTTKAPGKGNGLGLPICRQIVEEQHGGQLKFRSFPGQGTEFTIELPIEL